MRLTNREIDSIKSNVMKRDASARIFVFGSRIRDELAGGDIDILVESSKLTLSDKISILADLKNEIGDQKIDMILCGDVQKTSDAFIQTIRLEIQEL